MNLKNIFLCSTVIAMASCADWTVTDDVVSDVAGEGTYISLRIHRPGDDLHASRSPFGGQYGNGFEPANQWSPMLKGISNDYDIHDLCFFLVNTEGLPVVEYINKCPATTPFVGAYYVDDLLLMGGTDDTDDGHAEHPIDKRYSAAKVNVGALKIEPSFHRLIVVANVGDITGSCTTVGELLNAVADKGYSREADGNIYIRCYSDTDVRVSGNAPRHFAMGLYEEPSNIVLHTGTANDPHTASVTLERLSARVDFRLTQWPSPLSQASDPFAPIPYDVQGKESATLSRNWLTHVRLVNAAEASSYILRRSANDAEGTGLQYMGFEKDDANNIATNYLLDPYTSDKSLAPDTYYGTSRLETVRKQKFESPERVVSRKAFAPLDGGCEGIVSAFAYDKGAGYDQYFIVGYPQENILRREQMTRDYATGILCRSIYEPATVWRLNPDNSTLASETVLLTTDVLSDGTVPDGGSKGSHYGKTFWMIERLVPNPTESDRVYFVADAAGDQDAAGLTTADGKSKIKAAVELYLKTHGETGWTAPVEYVGGVAYNYYWLRHSNSQGTGHPFSPMEYSIVRNNIYRFSISSFTGPGAPSTDPALDNPDRIQPITYVHKWHSYTVEEVAM